MKRLAALVVGRLIAQKLSDAFGQQAKLGLEHGGSSPQQYAAMIADELARWRNVVKAAGIKLE